MHGEAGRGGGGQGDIEMGGRGRCGCVGGRDRKSKYRAHNCVHI